MSKLTILHNPRCSKSRQTLALLEDNGIEPTIVEYLKGSVTKNTLKTIIKLLDVEPRDIMRKNETEYKDAGLNDESLTKEQQIALMIEYPKVIERPIVFSDDKAIVGRPPENVLELIK